MYGSRDRAKPFLQVVKLHLGYVWENDCAEGVAVPFKFPAEFLDERIQLCQQRIRGVTAILVWIFQISYGFFNGCEVPAAGRVGNGGRRGLRWCFRLRWFQGYRWRLVLVYGANIARY